MTTTRRAHAAPALGKAHRPARARRAAPAHLAEAAPRALGRQAGSVVLNTGLNSLLGAGFWILASRIAPTEDVALAIAGSSLVILLSFLTQLNLSTALSRFAAAAGRGLPGLVRLCYSAALLGCLAADLGILLIALRRDGAVLTGSGWGFTVVLLLAVPLWTLFALQDNVLVALRRATWLPLENSLAAVLRLALLPLVAAVGAVGVFGAFLLPCVPAVLLVSWFLVRTVRTSAHEQEHEHRASAAPSRRELVRYAAADYPGVVATVAGMRLVPLLVLEIRGPEAAAYVGLAWQLLTVALLALPALSLVLLAELSVPGADVQAILQRTSRQLRWFVPVCLVAALMVQPVLSIAGPGYAEQGTLVLVGGVLALLPAAATELRIATLRVLGHPGRAALVQLSRSGPMVAAAVLLSVLDALPLLGPALLAANVLSWSYAGRLLRGCTPVTSTPEPSGTPDRSDAREVASS